jgi:hypothetical protein
MIGAMLYALDEYTAARLRTTRRGTAKMTSGR